MAETSLKETIYQYCKNPHLRNLFLLLYETTTGHDHDGTNSKAVSVSGVSDGVVTNAKLATDVKVGSLASLTTSTTSNVVAAINELVLDVEVVSAKVGTLSGLTTTAKSNTVAAINELVTSISGLASLTGVQTLTNKTLTSPTIATMLIDDGDAGLTVTSANQTNAAPTVTIPDIGDAADTFVMRDTEQTLTLKTLTTPIIASFYQDAGKTKLMTTPDTASDTLVALAATQTLTNKSLTAPALTMGVSSIDFASGHADYTLSAAEIKSFVLKAISADAGANIIVPLTAGKMFVLNNVSGQAITVIGATGTGITVASTKTAIVMSDGTNVIRITADA